MSKWKLFSKSPHHDVRGAFLPLENPRWRGVYATRYLNQAQYWLDGPYGVDKHITAKEARMYAKGLASPVPWSGEGY